MSLLASSASILLVLVSMPVKFVLPMLRARDTTSKDRSVEEAAMNCEMKWLRSSVELEPHEPYGACDDLVLHVKTVNLDQSRYDHQIAVLLEDGVEFRCR